MKLRDVTEEWNGRIKRGDERIGWEEGMERRDKRDGCNGVIKMSVERERWK